MAPRAADGSSSPSLVLYSMGFWVALAILSGITWFGYQTAQRLAETASWVEDTHQVMEGLLDLRASVAEVACNTHIHSLTGDDAEAKAVLEDLDRLDGFPERVRHLTAENQHPLKELADVEILLRSRRLELTDAIAHRRSAGPNVARDDAVLLAGVETMNRLRLLLTNMLGEEQGLLARWEERTYHNLAVLRWLEILGTAVGFAVLFSAFMGFRREVRFRARSEAALRERESHLATTLRSIGDGVIATDIAGRIVRMNPVAEQLTGWQSTDAVGRPFSEVFPIIHGLTNEKARDPVSRVLAENIAVQLDDETILIAKDATRRAIADSAAPIRDDAGKVAGVVLVFRDITARRLLDADLHEANAFLSSIIENIPSMVFVKRASDLRLERVNRAGAALMGRAKDSLVGKSMADVLPGYSTISEERDRATLTGLAPVNVPEVQIDTPEGPRWLRTKRVPIFDDRGIPKHILHLAEDITESREFVERLREAHDELERRVVERTAELVQSNLELQHEVDERKQAQAALSKSEEQLRQSQKMEAVGRLAGGIAHDFNNLLSVILAYGSFVKDAVKEDDPIRADVREIVKASERAAELTKQLLAFSRQQVLAPRLVDLNAIVIGVDKMLRRVIGEDIDLRVGTADGLAKIHVDPGQIEQVLMNLVVNARDAMPDGGTLSITTATVDVDHAYADEHRGLRPGLHSRLTVTDSGIGMDAATLARAFEPFFTTKGPGRGTGLGLATVFGIVQQSGGVVEIESEPGRGTSIHVFFPQSSVTEEKTDTGSLAPSRRKGSETILLVEDEEQVRMAARLILERSGYTVVTAPNGAEGLLVFERMQATIDLVVTDMVMPRLSGRQLVEKVTALRPGVKTLIMSGYTSDATALQGVLDAGISYLQKPFTPTTLSGKVREVLDAE